jgi:hypothetical protein
LKRFASGNLAIEKGRFSDAPFTPATLRWMHLRPLFLAALSFYILGSFPVRAQVEPTPGNGLVVGTYCCSTSAASNSLIVSGSVGIGTSSPATTLDVYGTINTRGNNAVWQDATNANLAVGKTALSTTVSQTGGWVKRARQRRRGTGSAER